MNITTDQIKELRNATGVSVMQCKNALVEAEGDIEKAVILLRKLSKKAADKKADRELRSGVVATYVHGEGSVGSMVELLCETDFVARNEDFKVLARDIAMHVAAAAPEFVRESEIKESDKTKALEIFSGEAEGKPEELKEQIITGKLEAFFSEKTLLNQSYIKNPEMKISQLLDEAVQKFGEKVDIGRISRFSISN
jgi:elongation factor Ts